MKKVLLIKLPQVRIYLQVVVLVLVLLLTGCSDTLTQNIHLKYGNPSKAGNSKNNYLLTKPGYALAYSCKAGIANWASWQLDRSWLAQADRSDDFRQDPDLPDGCYAARANDYRRSGYDRGHLTPSGDRTRNATDNSDTFLMSNIIPQSKSNNREVWRELEEYSRNLAFQGNELYIVAGGSGTAKKIAKSKITVPEFTWKAILVLEQPDRELSPDNCYTIAVWIPNTEEVTQTNWREYILSVDRLEKKTGYNFFADLDKQVQKAIERASYAN